MGLNKHNIEFTLFENKYKQIHGDYLSLGKQTINIDKVELRKLLKKYDADEIKIDEVFSKSKKDYKTRHGTGNIFDHELISIISDCYYNCLDISDYEGANILHDMNYEIPQKYHEKFDFIFNGSCLDNVFDPITFLKNTTKMLN